MHTARRVRFFGAALLACTSFVAAAADQQVAANNSTPMVVRSPDGRTIAFIRRTPDVRVDAGIGELEATEIWTSRADGSGAQMLIRGRAAGRAPEETLADLSELHFSPDGRRLYFLSAAWATSSAVHVIQIETGKEHYLCPGNSLEVIQRGNYAGYLMVTQHRYAMGGGSYDWLWLLTSEGKEMAPISMGDDVATETFRKVYVDSAGH